MKLALVGPFSPLRGGIAQFGDRAAQALEAQGHEIVRHGFRKLYPDRLFPGTSQYEPGEQAPQRGVDPLKPWTWRGAPGADATVAAYWSPIQALALRGIARRSSAPVIALVHNAIPHEPLPASRLLTRLFLGSCQGAIVLSEAVEADLKTLSFGGKVARTPHPAYDQFGPVPERDAARSALGLDRDVDMLLFFGLVRRYKGLDILLDAMPEILSKRPGAMLVVAGEFYDDAEQYRAQARRLAVEHRVRFEDRFIPDDEVSSYFGAADLIVQPYRSATQSGVLNVAAQAGVPAVLTGVGGLADAVERYGAGQVVPPERPAHLAAAVLQCLEPGRRRQMAEGMRRLAAERGWDAFCTTLESLIDELR